jgi:hypothetical protein
MEVLQIQTKADLTKFALAHGLVDLASSPLASSC